MEYTLIYRVETIDGTGFYHEISYHDYAIRQKFQMLNSHHPEPYDDGIESYEKHVLASALGSERRSSYVNGFYLVDLMLLKLLLNQVPYILLCIR